MFYVGARVHFYQFDSGYISNFLNFYIMKDNILELAKVTLFIVLSYFALILSIKAIFYILLLMFKITNL
jgi:hypothetical protein